MSIRTIFVPAGPGVDVRVRLDAVLPLIRGSRGHLTVVFVHPDPGQVLASLQGLAIAVDATLAKLESDTGAAFVAVRVAFEEWCARHAVRALESSDHANAGGLSASLVKRAGDLETLVSMQARLSDLVVLERADGVSRFASQAFDAAVFSGGRLSMVVPPRLGGDDPLEHVLVAWNGSLEATRALAQSLPLLKAAHRVSIFVGPRDDGMPQPASELARYLLWHGIAAEHLYDPALGSSVGERILATARTAHAGLIVMGAYTHSRARQYFLGGATQYLLNHSHVPLLMAH